AEVYNGLADAVINNDHTHELSQVGRHVILPSFFVSSGCFMYQLYQDSMAIVHWAGCPDIFLMLTANPKWHEIVENLLPGQIAVRVTPANTTTRPKEPQYHG
ncbi:hypothetical protein DACRYDRAFT_59512, partial [Dacryopinax primogenitus]